MKTKYFFLAAFAATFASCANEEYIGDTSPNAALEQTGDGSIQFGSGFKAVTRADQAGKAAADLLGNKFIVTGVKGDGTGKDQSDVFQSYSVEYTQNTAGTTESNTADWEYVGKSNGFSLAGSQAIKYWDYSTTAYDFAAYSVGTGSATGTAITYGSSEITPSTAPKTYKIDAAYTLTGSRDDLTKCYITDMKTVAKANYKADVVLEFRSLASKVRMAIYETVPGYSVKDVHFYVDDATAIAENSTITNTDATLFGGTAGATTGAFFTNGTYTVSFPHIGSANSGNSDYNKAHVAMVATASQTTQGFGPLNYTSDKTDQEPDGNYLKRSSKTPSFAGTTDPYYVKVLPNEEGKVLEMRVNYTLVSTDGSEEEINVHGAKAFVPQVYTKWLPNYAYTYIFKISDNSNGWTSTDTSDPKGLFPITFDAVVLDSEETGHQTTITTVATPSITTYQKGHVYSATDEYATGDIYVQVMNDNTLINDLNHQTASVDDKSFFYSLSAAKTEAEVMDALNIRTSGSDATVVGRNGLTLTPGTIDNTVTEIPGEDGNNITVSAGQAAKVSPASAGTYAYVYQVSTGSPTDVYSAVQLTDVSAPGDFTSNYYNKTAVGDVITYTQCVAGDYVQNNVYYKHFTNLNNVYAVKVIKVE